MNSVLHHVGLSRKIETNQQLDYGFDKNNPDWITYGPWYNTFICTKLHGTVFEKILEIQELIEIILCVLLMHMRNNILHLSMTAAA